jgi:very-short-patch-repair endonuclease
MDKELFRQSLINAKTPAESRLLYILSKDDYLFDKFEFQKPIGPYFADFCFDFKKLVVELDGSSHNGRKNKDRNRTKDIKELGYNVIRFSNDIVFKRPDVVIRKIMMARAFGRRLTRFFKDHVNKDIYIIKGSKVVRRKNNPAPGRKQANIDLL